MSLDNGNPQKQSLALINLALTLTGQIGCFTLLVLIAAAFLGRWLDAQFGSGRTFTLWLIIGSLPVTLFLMYLMVRSTVKRISSGTIAPEMTKGTTDNREEDKNRGTTA
jgi:ABC-type molybdate transport system permease subunit